ncbi:Sterol 3-beta-glucosyltransferase UGT80A2 [Linum perenne]
MAHKSPEDDRERNPVGGGSGEDVHDGSSSDDVSVDVDVTTDNAASSVSNSSGEASSPVKADSRPGFRQKAKAFKESHKLGRVVAKLFDETIPLKKKLKLVNRVAKIKDDGTVQFDVPVDIKPQSLDFGTGVVYHEAGNGESVATIAVKDIPPLQIVMLIVGTRGDVQPFVAIGKRLQEDGHRVRLATHANFKDFVLTAGLEFFPLGGDPKVLAGYMVKNKGFFPSGPSEIPVQRQQMREIIFSLLPACQDPDPETNIPFRAEAIIANPPAYGHTHVAEALKVPLHVIFTMPWTPTSEFPHPMSRVKQPVANRLSYQIVDAFIWLGIRDLINEFRKKQLKIRRVTYLSGHSSSPPDLPYGYIWSPHLLPKPKDWGPKIDVVGFCFLDLASCYVPPDDLVKWLEGGDPPVYVGFGSLPVQEPEKMTQMIVKALELTGQRGIINKGWGGLGNLAEPKDSIYLLDNCPHDWLFLRCKAVVHHGGAGTTAAGLKAACPTTIVPFFGDQPFWGDRVHARGVGPTPIPVDEFSTEKLVEAIKYMLDPEVKQRAVEIGKAMENEDGVAGAVSAFYKHFPGKKAEEEDAEKGVGRNARKSDRGSRRQPKDVKSGDFETLDDALEAELFHEKLAMEKKLKLYNRLATIQEDGTVQFEVPGDIEPRSLELQSLVYSESEEDESVDTEVMKVIPPLQIVMLIVGTRGDVQPFAAIGQRLQEDGHRVRLATHSNFKDFVLNAGLEFFPLGGDSKLLAT